MGLSGMVTCFWFYTRYATIKYSTKAATAFYDVKADGGDTRHLLEFRGLWSLIFDNPYFRFIANTFL